MLTECCAVIPYEAVCITAGVGNAHLNKTIVVAGTSTTGVKYKGYVEIPNLSDENDVDEVEVSSAAGRYFWVPLWVRRNPQNISISFP